MQNRKELVCYPQENTTLAGMRKHTGVPIASVIRAIVQSQEKGYFSLLKLSEIPTANPRMHLKTSRLFFGAPSADKYHFYINF